MGSRRLPALRKKPEAQSSTGKPAPALAKLATPARDVVVRGLLSSTALVRPPAVLALFAGLCLGAASATAQDSTWATTPGSADFNTAANWTPAVVPTGTASFGAVSNPSLAQVLIQSGTTIGGFTFNADAANYAITNNSTLTFTGAGIVVNGGSVSLTTAGTGITSFQNSSTAGSATLTASGNGAVHFKDTASGGTARVILSGGFADISGLSSGGTTAGSIEGIGYVYLGGKNLTVGGNNLSTSFLGAVLDGGAFGGSGGSLTKTGAGTLTLWGTNTYTGVTLVNGGMLEVIGSLTNTSGVTVNNDATLQVSGFIASSVTVNNGGELVGTGTVGNLTVANGGRFIPGLTITGNLAFQSGAYYFVGFSRGPYSITHVDGTASLTGGTVMVLMSPGIRYGTFPILTAAGGFGGTTFSGVKSPNDSWLNATLTYDVGPGAADTAYLTVTATLGVGASLAANHQKVASAINTFFNSGGSLPANVGGLFNLTGDALVDALARTSGEAATGAQQGAFQLGNQFLGMMLDPFAGDRGGSSGPALGFAPERAALPEEIAQAYAKLVKAPVDKAPAFEQRWSVWGGGFGSSSRVDGDAAAGSSDLRARTAGFAAGLDYRLTPGTVAGFALAGGGTSWALEQGRGGGKSDAFQAGIYATTRSGPLYLAGALAFANHWMSIDRTAPFDNRLTADFNAQSYSGRVEGGYRLATPVGGVTPYAAVQAQAFRTPAYAEVDANSSGGDFAHHYDARTGTHTRGELGARFDHVRMIDADRVLMLYSRLAWAHDWVSDPAAAVTFQAMPGAGFTVVGATPAKDSLLATAGAEIRLANNVTLAARFDGEFAGRAQSYAGTGTLRYAW